MGTQTLFSDGFEDGTWADNWNDHSQSGVSPRVNTNRSYSGSYALQLPSKAGSSSRNEVRSASTWSGEQNQYSAYVNKFNDGGNQNSRMFSLVDSANPGRKLDIYESSYNTNHLVLREKDVNGNVVNDWVLNSTELATNTWYKHSITIEAGTISAAAGSHSVSSVTTAVDWSTIDVRIMAAASGWNGGSNIDISVDAVNVTAPQPDAPTNTSQSVVDDDTIDLSWTDNTTSEDQYRIQVSEDGGVWSLVATVAANTTAYTYTATAGTNQHRFRVRAEANNNSNWDYTATVATDPTALSVTANTDSSIDLSWTGTRDASNYRVLRAQATGSLVSDYTEIGVPTTTTFSDTGLENGEKYFYRVQSEYVGTNSQLTAEVSRTTTLPAPTLDSLNANISDEITVSYTLNDNSPDGQVDIYRSIDGTKGTIVNTDTTTPSTTDPSSHSWTDGALADGEHYYYTVERSSDHATSTSTQGADTTLLPSPSGLSSTVTADDIALSWTDNADNEDGYRVYYGRSNNLLTNHDFEQDAIGTTNPTGWTYGLASTPAWSVTDDQPSLTGSVCFGSQFDGLNADGGGNAAQTYDDGAYISQRVAVSGGETMLAIAWGAPWGTSRSPHISGETRNYVGEDDIRLVVKSLDSTGGLLRSDISPWGAALGYGSAYGANVVIHHVDANAAEVEFRVEAGDSNDSFGDGTGGNAGVRIDNCQLHEVSQAGTDLAANTTSHTLSALLDGERYAAAVTAFTEHAELPDKVSN